MFAIIHHLIIIISGKACSKDAENENVVCVNGVCETSSSSHENVVCVNGVCETSSSSRSTGVPIVIMLLLYSIYYLLLIWFDILFNKIKLDSRVLAVARHARQVFLRGLINNLSSPYSFFLCATGNVIKILRLSFPFEKSRTIGDDWLVVFDDNPLTEGLLHESFVKDFPPQLWTIEVVTHWEIHTFLPPSGLSKLFQHKLEIFILGQTVW